MHAEHRTWFPFIMAGASILLLVVFIVIAEPAEEREDESSQAAFVEEGVKAPTDEEYKAEVVTIMESYGAHQTAGQTYEELLQVRVPAAFREVHLELVYAFADLQSGNTVEGSARLDLLTQQLDWLN